MFLILSASGSYQVAQTLKKADNIIAAMIKAGEEQDNLSVVNVFDDKIHCSAAEFATNEDVRYADALNVFIANEVPFRLREIHRQPEEIVNRYADEIIAEFGYNTDIMFNYDNMDDLIDSVLEQNGVDTSPRYE